MILQKNVPVSSQWTIGNLAQYSTRYVLLKTPNHPMEPILCRPMIAFQKHDRQLVTTLINFIYIKCKVWQDGLALLVVFTKRIPHITEWRC